MSPNEKVGPTQIINDAEERTYESKRSSRCVELPQIKTISKSKERGGGGAIYP